MFEVDDASFAIQTCFLLKIDFKAHRKSLCRKNRSEQDKDSFFLPDRYLNKSHVPMPSGLQKGIEVFLNFVYNSLYSLTLQK